MWASDDQSASIGQCLDTFKVLRSDWHAQWQAVGNIFANNGVKHSVIRFQLWFGQFFNCVVVENKFI
jgi:hypothetical protein